jgi:hypothetical protein
MANYSLRMLFGSAFLLAALAPQAISAAALSSVTDLRGRSCDGNGKKTSRAETQCDGNGKKTSLAETQCDGNGKKTSLAETQCDGNGKKTSRSLG